MHNINHTTSHRTSISGLLFSCLLSVGLFSSNLSAQIVDDSYWVIKPGDSLYKIARIIYPESTKKQAQLRKALIKQNPEVFKNGIGNISVGDKLQLPDFAIQQKEPVVATTPATAPTPKTTKKTTIKATPVAAVAVTPAPVNTTSKTKPLSTEPEIEAEPQNSGTDPQDIVGQVVINIGDLTAQNRGATRTLQRRSVIYRGDTLATGNRSHTQIRLKDGALLSLRPYTNIKIAEYNYNGSEDGNEKSIIELLKGGFRTITGAIGHLNKKNYQIRTSMATIGIRGTHYSLVLCQQASCSGDGEQVEDGLYGGVADGSIVIENQSGVHSFNNDQFFHLTSASASPVETLVPPQVLTHSQSHKTNKTQQADQSPNKKAKSQLRRYAVIFEPNQPNPVKKRIILPKDIALPPFSDFPKNIDLAPNGSAALISFNEDDNSGFATGVATPVIISQANDSLIVLGPDRTPIVIAEAYYDGELQRTVVNDFIAASAEGLPIGVPSDLGRDTSLGANWGRWNGDFTIREDSQPINALQNLHFVYSENITSPTQLANLGGIKTTLISYTSTGGTLPTDNLGNVGTNFASISMGADFITQEITRYDVNASVIDANTGLSVNYTAGIISPVPFTTLGSPFLIDGTGSCPGGVCAGEASVLFVGPQATGAITSFQINAPQAQIPSSIAGTAALTETAAAQEIQ